MLRNMDSNQPKWSNLQPGDCLGYFSRDIIDYAIAFKTWTRLAHVEIYEGDILAPRRCSFLRRQRGCPMLGK